MSTIGITDEIASYYPMLDIIDINGVEVKHLVNFDKVYEPIKYLGKGAYGTVRCYRERATGNLYAFKEIEITDKTDVKILQEEITVLASLSETNSSIVKYQDSFVYIRDGQPIYVIVTEYISGFTLHEYIDDLVKHHEVASIETVLNIGIWLLSLIAEIHAAGYVHRDIKPENIMVDHGSRRFVLIDFGLTCPVKGKGAGKDKLRGVVGTPEFIAPERWSSKKKSRFSLESSNLSILKKADVWAAGVTLYCIMEKRYPWSGMDIYTIGNQIIGPHPIEYTYPQADVINIITLMLNRNPQNRPSAIEIVRLLKELVHQKVGAFHNSSLPLFNLIETNDSDFDSSESDTTLSSDTDDTEINNESRRVTFNPIPIVHSRQSSILQSIPRLKLQLSSDSDDSSGLSDSQRDKITMDITNSQPATSSPRTFINKQSPPISPRIPSPHSKDGIISSRGSKRSSSPHTKDGSIISRNDSGLTNKKTSPRSELFLSILKRF
jgi:serine/threonine protein kinase